MKVAVTGATGFVGRHVVAALERAGVEPTLWVRPSAPPSTSRHRVARIDIADPPAHAVRAARPARRADPPRLGRPAELPSLHHFERELPAHYALLKRLVDEGLLDPRRRRHLLRVRHAVGAARRDAGGRAREPVRARQGHAAAPAAGTAARAAVRADLGAPVLPVRRGPGRDRAVVAAAPRGRVAARRAFRCRAASSCATTCRSSSPPIISSRWRCDAASTASSTSARGSRSRCDRWSRAGSRRTRWTIGLDLGRYPYPAHEPMAFWGDAAKLKRCLQAE